jgi:hypothetical protein
VLEQPALIHLYLSLNMQMAPLAQRGQVPLLAIRFVIVQVMNRQCVSILWIVQVPASLALIASSRAKSIAEFLCPAGRVLANEFRCFQAD